jgi:hypothetical protein
MRFLALLGMTPHWMREEWGGVGGVVGWLARVRRAILPTQIINGERHSERNGVQ